MISTRLAILLRDGSTAGSIKPCYVRSYRRVFDDVAKHPYTTTAELAARLDMDRSSAWTRLAALAHIGCVGKTGFHNRGRLSQPERFFALVHRLVLVEKTDGPVAKKPPVLADISPDIPDNPYAYFLLPREVRRRVEGRPVRW